MDSLSFSLSLEVDLRCLLLRAVVSVYFIWRRFCVHAKCTVGKWSLSLGGKDLSVALVMCCSDRFSFQSKINYCFITRMSLGLCFYSPIRKKPTIITRKMKDKTNTSHHFLWQIWPLPFPSLIPCESFHRFILGLKGSFNMYLFILPPADVVCRNWIRISVGSDGSHARVMERSFPLSLRTQQTWELGEERAWEGPGQKETGSELWTKALPELQHEMSCTSLWLLWTVWSRKITEVPA